jgi:lipid A 3-O-deacylase
MSRILFVVLAFLLAPVVAQAADAPVKQPDLLSFGGGYFDFDKTESHKQSGDFRVEYRWGLSMLPLLSSYFNSWDKNVQFHPYAGIEATTLGAAYGNGGWAMDWYICKHAIFTWSEGVGIFERGDMVRMGSVVEFRSMAEAGYRFDNDMRLTAEISHISNAGFTKRNPGAEIVGMYFHVPVSTLFGK